MSIPLATIVPWGRTADEYERMFLLGAEDYSRQILDCGGGPASFAAEWNALGRRVTAVDPLYSLTGPEIRSRFDAAADSILGAVRADPSRWGWSYHSSPDALRDRRRQALERFLADFDAGRTAQRYQTASLPSLPFPDDAFDLVLCSHLLFLYTEQLDAEFHRRATVELLRLAPEVRLFPLLTLAGTPSPHVETVLKTARELGARAERVKVPYELQPGGNEMLRLVRRPVPQPPHEYQS